MACTTALTIVRDAHLLRERWPWLTPLQLLDEVMEGYHGSSPDFSDPSAPEGAWTSPASPFGQLLYPAFCHTGLPIPASPQQGGDTREWGWFMDTWNAVVMPAFVDRYGLYGKPRGELARRIDWIVACIKAMQSRNREQFFNYDAAEYAATALYDDPETRAMGPVAAASYVPTIH